MRPSRLIRRGLTYYWRTNGAVVLGVGTAVTVLAGALLVGDSVRGSLRDLVLQRLGRTDLAVVSSSFFREQLADDVRGDPAFGAAFADLCPLAVVQGVVSEQVTGRRVSRVQVYGVDDRFWRFHQVAAGQGLAGREVLLSRALATEIGAEAGRTVLLRVQRPSTIPIESLHGRKEDLARTLRLTVRAVLAPGDLGEFSLRPQQGDVRAVFVPLRRLQQDLDVADRVNALLVSTRRDVAEAHSQDLEALLRRHAQLEDVGLTLRELPSQHRLSLGSDGGLIDDRRAQAATEAVERAGMHASPVMTYLVNSLRSGALQIPYSLVTALDLRVIAPTLTSATAASDRPPIVLNDWAARDLGVKSGDPLTLEYYVWEDPGRLLTRTAEFRIAAVVPIAGSAADRDLAPVYPGITESANLREWDPPFPVDLDRVRPVDEDYWHKHRTTPKAFIPLEVGQAMWRSRYGALTSVRIAPDPGTSLAAARVRYANQLRATIDPIAMGLSAVEVRADSLAASRGATDFGAYFTYFSFFLVGSALMLAALFFKLGVEQRMREVGLLRAVGLTTSLVRRLFASEALVLAVLGSLLGVLGAIGYGYVMMAGLRTWWVGAVGTTALTLHVSTASLALGALGGVMAALVCIWWTLGTLARVSERSLLAGQLAGDEPPAATGRRDSRRMLLTAAVGLAVLTVLLVAGTLAGWLDRTSAFFGAGTSLLASWLCWLAFRLRRPTRGLLQGHGWWPLARLGLRNAAYRPGRSVLSIAVIASATFVLISVDAFRRDDRPAVSDRHSGAGGYSLLVESLLPIVHDPNGREGRQLLGLDSVDGIAIAPFRVLPGDDASCLNLYAPRNPRIIAARSEFLIGRFAFQSSLATTDAERVDPWLLLQRDQGDGAIPVIADGNSMTYVLHRALGDDILISHGNRPLRLRLVAALADSVLQGELLMSEANFLKLFPEEQGYRFLLIETPANHAAQVGATIEDHLDDFGAEAVPTANRLAEFHRVENTYLSTFQTLGGLGLLLGTIGLATVLLRNVLERRRELALLGAIGYRRAHFFVIVIAENVVLLVWGLVAGVASALVAVAPAAADRGGRLPTSAGGWLLLLAVFGAGLLSSIVATRAAIQTPLLDALKAE